MIVFGGIYEVTKELNDLSLFDLRQKKWITLFEETHSPVGKRAGANMFGNTLASKDGFSLDESPKSVKKGMVDTS